MKNQLWLILIILVLLLTNALAFTVMQHNHNIAEQYREENALLCEQVSQLQDENFMASGYTRLTVLGDSDEVRYEVLLPTDPEADYVYLKTSMEEIKDLHEKTE